MSIASRLICLGLVMATIPCYGNGGSQKAPEWKDTLDISPYRALRLRCNIFHLSAHGQKDSIFRQVHFTRIEGNMYQPASPHADRMMLNPAVVDFLKNIDDSLHDNGTEPYTALISFRTWTKDSITHEISGHEDTVLFGIQPFMRALPTSGPPPSSFPTLWVVVGLSLGTILIARSFVFRTSGYNYNSPHRVTPLHAISFYIGKAFLSMFRPRLLPPLPDAPEDSTFHVLAEIEKDILIDVERVLQVTLSREALQTTKRNMTVSSGLFHTGSVSPLLVRVTGLENCRIVDQTEKTARLPAPESPEILRFIVVGTHTGKVRISIDIWQDRMPISSCLIEPNCVGHADSIPRDIITTAARSQSVHPVRPQTVQLYIEETYQGNEIYYEYMLNAPQGSLTSQQGILSQYRTKPIIGSRNEYVRHLYEAIDQLWIEANGNKERYKNLLLEYGSNLCSELIPPSLQKILFDNRHKLTEIQVISREPFIPWELLLVSDPDTGTIGPTDKFLGEMGLVRWLIDTYPAHRLRIRQRKAFYLVPTYHHHQPIDASEEIAYLKEKFDARSVEPTYDAVMQLLQTPESFDLLHFACHGETPGASLNDSRILLNDGIAGGRPQPDYLKALSVQHTAKLSAKGGPQPIVMINACDSGRLVQQLTNIGGFAQAFMSKGAGVFIGALWTIEDSAASTFGIVLYEHMRSGHTLSAATIQARLAARQEGDATWLAYAVYGHPDARIEATI